MSNPAVHSCCVAHRKRTFPKPSPGTFACRDLHTHIHSPLNQTTSTRFGQLLIFYIPLSACLCSFLCLSAAHLVIGQVFELPPDPPRAGDGGSTSELPSRSVDHEDLTEVGQATRLELRRAMVQRFAGRVFDERTIDPSIFRDAAVVLVPSYNNARLLDAFKLQERDKASVASNSK